MGASQTKEQTISPKANYTPEVEVISEKTSNAHYGEVRVVKDKETEQVLILKEVVVNTKQAFDAESEFLNNRVELSHPNVAQIVGYNTKDQQNFCSTYYKISIYVENLEQTLQVQLEERIASHYTYTETEILQVADSLISGLSYFQSQGFSHGDIRPCNIFVQGTTYKLSDPSLAAQKGQNGLTLAIIQGQKTLLAPELIAQVPKSDFEIKTDKYKADVFALGLTLLSIATLSSVEDLYNFEEGTFAEASLNERLEKIRYRYSPFTFDLIKSMLTIEEETRPDFVALSNTLLPYQEHIRSGASLYLYSKETVKRSALPEDYAHTEYANNSNDDLEARIRAALERSEQTFRAVAARDNAFASGLATGTVQPTEQHQQQAAELAKSYVAADVRASQTQQQPATSQGYVADVRASQTQQQPATNQGYVADVRASQTQQPATNQGYQAPIQHAATEQPAAYTTTTTYNYTPTTYAYSSTAYTPYGEDQKKSQTLIQKIEGAVEHAIEHRHAPTEQAAAPNVHA